MNNDENKINPFKTIKVFTGGKNKTGKAAGASTMSIEGENTTAFPLKKLAYGGISSQFLGIVSPNIKADNDNKPKNNIFPF